ncbi:MAG: hypothetical protein Phyf2KO_10600 [Phycisphaerales bacterium]
MMLTRTRAMLGCALGLCLSAGASAQIAVSDFSSGTDGWRTVANKNAAIDWQPGMITQQDIHYGTMAFKAPSKFLGDVSAAYGGTLSFDFMTDSPNFWPSQPKIRMSGNTQWGTLTVKLALPEPTEANTFQAYEIPFEESDNWSLMGRRGPPTQEEFQAIISGLTDLRIIGDTSSESNELFSIANVRLDPPDQPEPEPGALKVYIMAGQSNMAGCDDVRNVDPMWASANDDVMLYWGNELNPGFAPLTPGTSGASCADDAPSFYFGPELSFGSDIAFANPDEQIVIIKFAVGGTSLFNYWTTPTREYPDGGVLWNEIQFAIDDVLNQLTAMGHEYRVEGFLWMQGESDTDKRYRARKYTRNLTRFIASMRSFVGDPEMPFILGRIRDAGQPHAQMVRDAQVYVANNIPNVYWIDTDDLGWLPDGIHYDEESMIELGHRFADIVIAID